MTGRPAARAAQAALPKERKAPKARRTRVWLASLAAPALVGLLMLASPVAPAAAAGPAGPSQAALVRVVAPPDGPELSCSTIADSAGGGAPDLQPTGGARETLRATLEPLTDTTPVPRGRPRIALWGDSHTAAGPFVETLLEAWGLPPGSHRPSFIPPSFGQPNVRLRGLHSCSSGPWRWRTAWRQPAAGTRFAKGLVGLASETAGSTLAFDFRAAGPGARLRWLDLAFAKDDPERALVLALRVNGGPEHLVFLYGNDVSLLRVQAEAAGGGGASMATLQLRLVAGQVVIEGLAPAYADAATAPTVDVFSVPGSTIAGWQHVDARYLVGREIDPVDHDLVLFQFGTNDAVAADFDANEFARAMRAALTRLRGVAPRARCIVIGPPDRGAGGRGGGAASPESRRRSQLHVALAAVQEHVAPEFGCGFWHWQRAMGGPGAAGRWARAEPRLMQPDLIHLTAEGYAQSARALAAAFPLKPAR